MLPWHTHLAETLCSRHHGDILSKRNVLSRAAVLVPSQLAQMQWFTQRKILSPLNNLVCPVTGVSPLRSFLRVAFMRSFGMKKSYWREQSIKFNHAPTANHEQVQGIILTRRQPTTVEKLETQLRRDISDLQRVLPENQSIEPTRSRSRAC